MLVFRSSPAGFVTTCEMFQMNRMGGSWLTPDQSGLHRSVTETKWKYSATWKRWKLC